ncbi:TPA: hypothetical protein N0F65_005777 [Lagenidium giganteum]|uniref:FYVE-type domain-containing protein n=1 Tax=Lagenidium giganteum TaxID=4803 RepID=A0AAV2YW18_9STRA|nr:TPA: hypothetical protein N0F65_005777 [Lagenidium giganteum]
MSTSSSSSSAASNAGPGYGDRVAKQYKVKENLTAELETTLTDLGAQKVRKLIRLVSEGDAADEHGGGTTLGSSHAMMKLMQEKENYRIYELKDEKEQLLVMKGVLLLQSSSCDEVMELVSGRHSQDVFDFYQDMFGSQFEDGRILLHRSSPTSRASSASSSRSLPPASPVTSLSFHWLALKDTSVHLPSREFFFMRYNQATMNEDPASSNRVAYGASVWESVEMPTCTPLFSSSVMKRGSLKNCGFVVESSDETEATRVTFFITAPLNNDTLQNDRAFLLKAAACVRMIPTAIVNYRIRMNLFKDKSEWDARDACGLCTTSFSLFRRQHHCRMCGVSICSRCSNNVRDSRGKNPNGVRVCLSCLNGEDTSALWSQSIGRKMKHGSVSSSRDSCASKDSWSTNSMERSRVSYQSSESFSSAARTSAMEDLLEGDTFNILKVSTNGKSSTSEIDEDDVFENTPFDYLLTFKKGNPWPDAPVPALEQERLKRIQTLNLSKQYADKNLKELLEFARTSISCPVAAVGVISASTSLLVTAIGLNGDQLPRDMALESHTIMSNRPLVVLDTEGDDRFAMNPLVSSLRIRFYIGIPLVSKEGIVVGSLSLGDTAARDRVSGSDVRSLQRIAQRIMDKMDNHVDDTETRPNSAPKPINGMLLI